MPQGPRPSSRSLARPLGSWDEAPAMPSSPGLPPPGPRGFPLGPPRAPPPPPPLADHADAVAGTMGFIEAQFPYIEQAVKNRSALAQLTAELAWARRFAASVRGRNQPQALV